MITLLPILKITKWVAVGYAVILIVFLSLSHTFYLNVSEALTYGSALYGVLFIVSTLGWKLVWKVFPILNRTLFPLIDGEWSMIIHWHHGDKNGTVEALATIKQSLMRLSMEVASQESDSETLLAAPKKDPESGTPQLYYVYRVTRRLINDPTASHYLGAAILRFVQVSRKEEMRGNYFTDAGYNGYFELKRRRK